MRCFREDAKIAPARSLPSSLMEPSMGKRAAAQMADETKKKRLRQHAKRTSYGFATDATYHEASGAARTMSSPTPAPGCARARARAAPARSVPHAPER